MEANEIIKEACRIGGRMANMCHNGKQSDVVHEQYRDAMAELQPEWDRIENQLRPLADTIQQQSAEIYRLKRERDDCRDALEMLYDKYENGVPCTEHGDGQGCNIGNAIELSSDEEQMILAVIPTADKAGHTILATLALIRESSGHGSKPMLSELPELVARDYAELERLRAVVGKIAERVRKPDEGQNDHYERLAAQFYKETGRTAPGKSVPLDMTAERDLEADGKAWDEWCSAPYKAAAAAMEGESQ